MPRQQSGRKVGDGKALATRVGEGGSAGQGATEGSASDDPVDWEGGPAPVCRATDAGQRTGLKPSNDDRSHAFVQQPEGR